jgi:hypothetical protein
MVAADDATKRTGSLAIFAAIRRVSSLLSSLAAERRPGSVLDIHQFENSRQKS